MSDDEASEVDECTNAEVQDSKKRKATSAAAYRCLKLVGGKRVRLIMEQKAKATIFDADHSHLSYEAVINWAVEPFNLEGTLDPALITSFRKEDKVECAKRYLSQEFF